MWASFFSLSGWTGMVLATLRYSGTRQLIGMEAGSPPPLTDYSYRLVRFHEAIICLHTPAVLGMARYRNARRTLSPRWREMSVDREESPKSKSYEIFFGFFHRFI